MAQDRLSAVGGIVRRHDPDRFFTALFAPPEHRETLFTLYAFNHELARAREAAREPFAALIRLQWWREVVEGARRRHEVAGPLGEALDSGQFSPAALMAMIDAREAETETVPDLVAFTDYVRGTAGGVMVAAAAALGMSDAEALRDAGAAYGVLGVLANTPFHRGRGWDMLPRDGTDEATLRGLVRGWLGQVPRVPTKARAAALPLVLARRRLAGREGRLGARFAVIRAALLGL